MNNFAYPQYWNTRYSEQIDGHEWLDEYNGEIRNALSSIVNGEMMIDEDIHFIAHENCANVNTIPFKSIDKCRVLIMGCGNSSLGEDMMKDGWTGGITNVDFSPVVIDQMKERYSKILNLEGDEAAANENGKASVKQKPNMSFICADVTKGLDFQDSSFDLIIHKGLLDAMTCHFMRNYDTKALMNECVRLLDKNGAMVCISSAKKENRLEYLEHEGWTGGICIKEVLTPQVYEQRDENLDAHDYYYIYTCLK